MKQAENGAKLADIGMIGLAVMGENLSLNLASKGYRVAVYNIETDAVTRFINGRGNSESFIGAYSFAELVSSVRKPRVIMMMIRAGDPVDQTIAKLLPYMETGDIIIDGGNSHFADTSRRVELVESKGLRYIGTGVSGGEEGALTGPSIMPGGSRDAWPRVKPLLQAIAARTDGQPCCDWVGEGGAGHFVKMVHNGIEYGDMQLICEAYHLLRDHVGLTAEEAQKVFARWNAGELNSYLIEITADILGVKDADGAPLLDRILDAAGQKGTGKWAVMAALDAASPLTLIGEAVFARCLSADKDGRVAAAHIYNRKILPFEGDKDAFIDALGEALYAAKIISYAQGYALMRQAAEAYGWRLNYGGIALMWRGGCIIRSAFLGKIKEAFEADPDLPHLALAPYFRDRLAALLPSWRRVAAAAVSCGVPSPALTSALAYFDGLTCENLPANLLQAQRDYFGAHTYERTDRPRGERFHTNWTGRGGDTAATAYNA